MMVKRELELTHGFSDRMVDIIERQPEDPPKNWDMIQRRVVSSQVKCRNFRQKVQSFLASIISCNGPVVS